MHAFNGFLRSLRPVVSAAYKLSPVLLLTAVLGKSDNALAQSKSVNGLNLNSKPVKPSSSAISQTAIRKLSQMYGSSQVKSALKAAKSSGKTKGFFVVRSGDKSIIFDVTGGRPRQVSARYAKSRMSADTYKRLIGDVRMEGSPNDDPGYSQYFQDNDGDCCDYWEDFDECCVGGRNLTPSDILKQPSLSIRAIRGTGFVQAYDKIKAMPNVNYSGNLKP